jgi:hypothetical protein
MSTSAPLGGSAVPADAAAWSVDLALRRIRDCSALASVLKSANGAERRWLGRSLANVLAALPAAQAELGTQSARVDLPRLKELARQIAMLETVVLELAREHRIEGLEQER